MLILGTVRDDAADFLAALLFVYSLLIVVYVLTSLLFAIGVRLPYARWSDAILNFLREVCEPYLRPFRRFIPMIGPIDISPIVAIFVLQIVGGILVELVRG